MRSVSKDKALMGTIIQITINNPQNKTKALDTIDLAFDHFLHVIQKFSRFDERSELSILNKHSGEWFATSQEMYKLIKLALEASKETNGVFDPTILDILKAYGYDSSFNPIRIKSRMQEKGFLQQLKIVTKNRPRVQDILINDRNRQIKLQKHQHIDLGAVAKGYAIDLAFNEISRHGFPDFLINAGGDVRVSGTKKVALFDPRTPNKPLGITKVQDGSIAGSGNFAKNVNNFNHLINLSEKTSQKLEQEEQTLQSYVVAPEATQADLYSTVLFLLGSKGLSLIHRKGYKGLIITNKEVYGDIEYTN